MEERTCIFISRIDGDTIEMRETFYDLACDILKKNLNQTNNDSGVTPTDCEACALELEYQSFSANTVASLYRRSILKTINEIKRHTEGGELYPALLEYKGTGVEKETLRDLKPVKDPGFVTASKLIENQEKNKEKPKIRERFTMKKDPLNQKKVFDYFTASVTNEIDNKEENPKHETPLASPESLEDGSHEKRRSSSGSSDSNKLGRNDKTSKSLHNSKNSFESENGFKEQPNEISSRRSSNDAIKETLSHKHVVEKRKKDYSSKDSDSESSTICQKTVKSKKQTSKIQSIIDPVSKEEILCIDLDSTICHKAVPKRINPIASPESIEDESHDKHRFSSRSSDSNKLGRNDKTSKSLHDSKNSLENEIGSRKQPKKSSSQRSSNDTLKDTLSHKHVVEKKKRDHSSKDSDSESSAVCQKTIKSKKQTSKIQSIIDPVSKEEILCIDLDSEEDEQHHSNKNSNTKTEKRNKEICNLQPSTNAEKVSTIDLVAEKRKRSYSSKDSDSSTTQTKTENAKKPKIIELFGDLDDDDDDVPGGSSNHATHKKIEKELELENGSDKQNSKRNRRKDKHSSHHSTVERNGSTKTHDIKHRNSEETKHRSVDRIRKDHNNSDSKRNHSTSSSRKEKHKAMKNDLHNMPNELLNIDKVIDSSSSKHVNIDIKCQGDDFNPATIQKEDNVSTGASFNIKFSSKDRKKMSEIVVRLLMPIYRKKTIIKNREMFKAVAKTLSEECLAAHGVNSGEFSGTKDH